MLKHLVLAAFLTAGATAAYAQTQPQQQASRPAQTERTVSTGDFNVSGEMAGSAIIGARVRNDARDTIGKVDDVYVDKDGAIKAVVVSVGGFLGVGSKNVAVKWEDLKFGRDGDSLTVTTSLDKEALEAMPDYKNERRQPAPPPTQAPTTPTRPGGGG